MYLIAYYYLCDRIIMNFDVWDIIGTDSMIVYLPNLHKEEFGIFGVANPGMSCRYLFESFSMRSN